MNQTLINLDNHGNYPYCHDSMLENDDVANHGKRGIGMIFPVKRILHGKSVLKTLLCSDTVIMAIMAVVIRVPRFSATIISALKRFYFRNALGKNDEKQKSDIFETLDSPRGIRGGSALSKLGCLMNNPPAVFVIYIVLGMLKLKSTVCLLASEYLRQAEIMPARLRRIA